MVTRNPSSFLSNSEPRPRLGGYAADCSSIALIDAAA